VTPLCPPAWPDATDPAAGKDAVFPLRGGVVRGDAVLVRVALRLLRPGAVSGGRVISDESKGNSENGC
jgi:hypothetical protein